MVAGGTGITPMLQLLRYGSLRDKQLVLVYANKSKEDVMYAGEIESLKQHYGDQLTIVHSLDNVDGYLTPTIIKECAGNGDRIKFLVCGPDAFLRHVCGKKQSDTDQGPLGGILHRLGYTQHNVIKL
jgi:ferredoxin-NADP reductase